MLAFRSSPNYESPTDQDGDNAYEVTVKATMGSLMATRSVTVNVTNVDEPGTVNISSPNNEVKVDIQLTAELDEGDEETVIGWQWASGGSNTGPWSDISGATNNTYTPEVGDVGNYLQATVTYNDPLGSGKTLSAVTSDAVEAAPTGGTPGTVSLSQSSGLVSGDPVTATLTDPDNPTNQVWLWERSANGSTNWSNISGATSASYTTTAADAGNYLRATVTYDDDSGTGLDCGRRRDDQCGEAAQVRRQLERCDREERGHRRHQRLPLRNWYRQGRGNRGNQPLPVRIAIKRT